MRWRALTTVSLILSLGGVAAASASPIAFRQDVEVSSRDARLGDLADLSGLPDGLRARASILVVAALSARQSAVRFADADVASRARALMPALAEWLPAGNGATITVRMAAFRSSARAARGPCLRALTSVRRGEVAAAGDFVPADCGGDPHPKAFSYDTAMGVVRVDRDLAAGDVAPGVSSRALAAVLPGQPLYVTARAGRVIVERRVHAVQAARLGRAVFVSAEDGAVFAAPGPGAP